MKHTYLAALAVLASFAFFVCAACGPTSSGGHGQPADDDASPGDDDLSPVADDDATPADDDLSPDDDDDDNNDNDASPGDDDNEDVFAVGDNGTILHYEGSTWSPMDSGTVMDLQSVWGSSRSDIYAAGTTFSSYEDPIGGVLLHYDGSAWSDGPTLPGADAQIYSDVWGTSASDVYITGGAIYGYDWASFPYVLGLIFHYDGASWSIALRWFYIGYFVFAGVWGSSPSDVFAIGNWDNYDLVNPENGFVIVHSDGKRWTLMDAASNVGGYYHLAAIWGTSHSDVFAVGSSGDPDYGDMVMHYDGLRWSELPVPSGGGGLYAVWGASASDVFASGTNDTSMSYVLHYDGATWIRTVLEDNALFEGLWGTSSSQIYGAGIGTYGLGLIFRFDGSSWSPMNIGSTVPALAGVWGPAR